MERTGKVLFAGGMFLYSIFATTSIAISESALGLALVGWGMLCIHRRRLIVDVQPFHLPLASFLAIAAASSFAGALPTASLEKMLSFTFILPFLAMPSILNEKERSLLAWSFLLFSLLGGTLFLSARGILERGSWWHQLSMGEATRIAMAASFAAGVSTASPRGRTRVAVFLLYLVGMAALTLSLERGPWAAAFAALAVAAVIEKKRWTFAATATLLVLTVVAAVSIPPIRQRVEWTLKQAGEPSYFVRARMWALGGRVIARFPAGIGQHVRKEYQKMFLPADIAGPHFHSNAVDIPIEYGIPALLLWAWWICSVVHHSRRFSTANPSPGGLPTGAAVAFAAFAIAGLTEYNFTDQETLLLMCFFMEMAVPFKGTKKGENT